MKRLTNSFSVMGRKYDLAYGQANTWKRKLKNDKYELIENAVDKLGQLEDIEEQLGIDLITFLKGIDPDTCFMQITKEKNFYLCGDAYYGDYSKEELLKLIQELLFMYWVLTKENK